MEIRNTEFNEHGTIDCEANHPRFGWIPMTLSPDDEITADLFSQAAGTAQAYTPPPEQD